MGLELNHFEIDLEGGRDFLEEINAWGKCGLTKMTERDFGLFT